MCESTHANACTMCAKMHAWRLEDNFEESALSFYHVASRNPTQVIRLVGSHLAGPSSSCPILCYIMDSPSQKELAIAKPSGRVTRFDRGLCCVSGSHCGKPAFLFSSTFHVVCLTPSSRTASSLLLLGRRMGKYGTVQQHFGLWHKTSEHAVNEAVPRLIDSVLDNSLSL